jgi:two-component system NtrC family sensor kinase
MKAPRWTHSLKSRIVVSYSLILILGGLSTSMIGIYVTGQALMEQGQRQAVFGVSAAHTTYTHHVDTLRQAVELLASNTRLERALQETTPKVAIAELERIRVERQLDYLLLADRAGRVTLRTSGPGSLGESVAQLAPAQHALRGHSAASTELVPTTRFKPAGVELPTATSTKRSIEPDGGPGRDVESGASSSRLDMVAAAPVINRAGNVVALIVAGRLLSCASVGSGAPGQPCLVARLHMARPARGETPDGRDSVVSIFQGDVRIATSVAEGGASQVIGRRAPAEAADAVLDQGRRWVGRIPLGDEWYIAAYEPIENLAGQRVGMLAVGLLETPYTAVRDRVTLSFAAVALLCFMLIVLVTYFLTRSLVRPLEEMVLVSRAIADGNLEQRVHVRGQSELALLSSSFNDMLDRIVQMKSQLEQLARTLEQKVEDRTQQLVKVQEQAARQQRLASVGQLAAGVAHEINNPLGGILTFASLILEELRPGDPHREDMEEVVRQAQRCRKIVSELLEFSRQREAPMSLANINDVVHRTLALLERQASFHDIHIVRKFDPRMPRTVVDESQMQQVFMNIILNAVDAMEGRGDLTIETRHSTLKGELLVRITDTGCGIPDDIKESIFDPFFTTKDPGKGTGLGLAVACRIVQAHGGRTEVESRVGTGTSFTIYLPIASDVPAADSDPLVPGP